jgi:outer membrane protein TolC
MRKKEKKKKVIDFLLIIVVLTGVFSVAHAEEPMSWRDCLRESAQNHPDLIAIQEKVIQSQADKRIYSSGIFPQLNATLNASTINSSLTGSSSDFGYGVSGTLLVFDGLQNINNIHAASENIKAVEENFKFTSASVRFELRQAFVNLLKAQELINLTQAIYQLRKSNLELISLRYESGTEHKGALLAAKANLSQAIFEINAAKRGLTTAQRKLSKELGRAQFLALVVQGDFEIDENFNTNPDYEKVAEKDPSLLQITAQKNAAGFAVLTSKGYFLPDVVLNAGAAKSDDHWLPQENDTSVGIKVSLPIFSGGANVARLSKARSVYRQLEQTERSQRDAVIYGLEKSWSDFADAFEAVNVQKIF